MKKIFYIIFGNALIALAVTGLLLNNNIVVGGVSGIGAVLEHAFGLPVYLLVSLLNVALFLLGLISMGKGFAAKTLVSTFSFPLLLQIFSGIDSLSGLVNNGVVAALLAGCLIGSGLGITLKSGASTGGVDIIGVVASKRFGFSLRGALNAIDFSILLLQIPFHGLSEIALGLVTVFVTYRAMNFVMNCNKSILLI